MDSNSYNHFGLSPSLHMLGGIMQGFKLLCLVMGLALAGCDVGEVGDGDGDGSGSGNGMGGGQSFNAMIAPLVTGCTGCHGGATPPNLSSFSALESKYKMKPGSSNVLVTKGVHASLTAYFTDPQKTTISNWIDSLP